MISIDHAVMRTAIRAHIKRIKAVRGTLSVKGRAEAGSYTAHGREVVASMAERGIYPLAPTTAMHKAVQAVVERKGGEALRRSETSQRVSKVAIRNALMAGAAELVKLLQERIIKGGLGTNAEGYRKAKLRYQFMHGPSQYGMPASYGIWSGAFIRSIRTVWRSV